MFFSNSAFYSLWTYLSMFLYILVYIFKLLSAPLTFASSTLVFVVINRPAWTAVDSTGNWRRLCSSSPPTAVQSTWPVISFSTFNSTLLTVRTPDIISLYSTTVTYLASKAIEFGEKRKKVITRFKIIQGHRGRYQSTARMRLPVIVINSKWQPISYRCRVIAAYCSNFGHFTFLSHLLWA